MIAEETQRLISAAVIIGGLVVMSLYETARPLRGRLEGRLSRLLRNLTIGGISLAVMTLLQAPLLIPAAAWAEERGLGLLRLVELPPLLNTFLAIVLLDYTLWWWHMANHKVPFLWRYHLPHHVDRDLDATTALRFHFGELTLSIAYRAAQIIVIGVSTYTVWIWQTILFASILFHHSNAKFPVWLERLLLAIIVTPRMHGIHHSTKLNETNSNWSSLFSWWDYLHGTLLLNVPQTAIAIGVPAYDDASDVTIGKVLGSPFVRQRDDWREADGTLSSREHDATSMHVLAE